VSSPRYLSGDERLVIADGVRAGRTKTSIALELGRSVSTVCREVHRNAEVSGEYRPHAAHQRMLTLRPRPKQRRVVFNLELRGLVQERLDKRWSHPPTPGRSTKTPILVFTEGEATEPTYLTHLHRQHRQRLTMVIDDTSRLGVSLLMTDPDYVLGC
jgi:transposase, IS30 family